MAGSPVLPRSARLASVLLVASLPYAGARADDGFLIGDSIAAAMGDTIGMGGVAHHSVSLRRTTIAEHFAHIPKGTVAIMSLGLNDAAIPIKAMRHHIERVIEGALATHERIVLGPRRQVESVACPQLQTHPGLWQPESDGTPDHVDHLVIVMSMRRVAVQWTVGP